MARYYRLLVYEGDPDWIEMNRNHPRHFIKPGQPYRCGKGSIHEVVLNAVDPKSLAALFSDEAIAHELRSEEEEAE